jgi:hypothetical protein
LGTQYYRLHYLCTTGKITPPRKNVSGGYEWTPEDVERARVALSAGKSVAAVNGSVASPGGPAHGIG